MSRPKIKELYFPSESRRYLGLLATDEAKRGHAKAYDAEIIDKLMRLMGHYDITPSPTQFYELSLALARDMYPEPRKRGRKTKWGGIARGTLVVEVERIIDPNEPTRGIEWACSVLARREPWLSFLEPTAEGGLNPADALRAIYFKSRSTPWAAMMRDVFKYHEAIKRMDGWQREYLDNLNDAGDSDL